MTIQEAVERWRLLTPEQVEEEKTNNIEFHEALDAAIKAALSSGDIKQKFWLTDAARLSR